MPAIVSAAMRLLKANFSDLYDIHAVRLNCKSLGNKMSRLRMWALLLLKGKMRWDSHRSGLCSKLGCASVLRMSCSPGTHNDSDLV